MTAHDARLRHTAFGAGRRYLLKPYDMSNSRSASARHAISPASGPLHHIATTDGLTTLASHSQFREQIDREFLRTRRYGAASLMMSIYHFKAINDMATRRETPCSS